LKDSCNFRLVREALRAEQGTPCARHSIARAHVTAWSVGPSTTQQLTISIASMGSTRLRILTLPLSEPTDHLLGSSGFLAETGTHRVHANDDAAVVVRQLIVVVALPRWLAGRSRLMFQSWRWRAIIVCATVFQGMLLPCFPAFCAASAPVRDSLHSW